MNNFDVLKKMSRDNRHIILLPMANFLPPHNGIVSFVVPVSLVVDINFGKKFVGGAIFADQGQFNAIKNTPDMDVESLARELHEAGREAVVAGATVAAEKFGEKTRAFIEWDDCTETVREGRRIQAQWLLNKYDVVPK
jgi:hypothetical protein